MRWRSVFRELIRGKSIARAMFAGEVAKLSLRGSYIDLGSKDGWGAQYRHMDTAGASVTYSDSAPSAGGTLKVNVEEEFSELLPKFDGALMFFLLEHVYDFNHVLREARKVVHPGGQLVGAVPQIQWFHPDPDDYFRFTGSGLRRSLQDAGWGEVSLTPVGAGPLTVAAEMLGKFTRFRLLRIPIALAALAVDNLAIRLGGRNLRNRYALCFLFEAVNPGD